MPTLDSIKRPENLNPGDKVKAWGDDLLVRSAQPNPDGSCTVAYEGEVVTRFTYPPGVLIEIADTTVDAEVGNGG